MNQKHHYSIYVSDERAQKLLEAQESKSGFIADLLTKYAAGELVVPDDAKQRKLMAEARLAELKVAAFTDDRELKREALRADINLKVQAGHLSSLNFQRALAQAPGAPRVKQYIFPNSAGSALDMFCPICLKVQASSIHATEADYTRAKSITVMHAVNEHGAIGTNFDTVFPEFAHFERLLFQKVIRIAADAGELDRLFDPALPTEASP